MWDFYHEKDKFRIINTFWSKLRWKEVYLHSERILVLVEVESICIDRPNPSSELFSLLCKIRNNVLTITLNWFYEVTEILTSTYTCCVRWREKFSCTWYTMVNWSNEPSTVKKRIIYIINNSNKTIVTHNLFKPKF